MGIYLSKTDSLCYTSKTKRKKCKYHIEDKSESERYNANKEKSVKK